MILLSIQVVLQGAILVFWMGEITLITQFLFEIVDIRWMRQNIKIKTFAIQSHPQIFIPNSLLLWPS